MSQPFSALPSEDSQDQTSPTAYQSEPFIIDFSNRYSGHEGHGRFVISAIGSGEEIFPSNAPEQKVRHFSSLTLRFLFFKFAFQSPCLGVVHLTGEVRCEVGGDYDLQTEEFLGEAHCIHGPLQDAKPIFYEAGGQNFEIELDADIQIDGNVYRYGSYTHEGLIRINGAENAIEEIIAEGKSCH